MRLDLDREIDFQMRLDDSGGPDACWPYQGCRDQDGYGQFKIKGRQYKAHRVAYLLAHGSIDDALQVRHRCDNPPCCNPAHLLQGTPKDNTQDAVDRGRMRGPQGERNKGAKLTEADVRAIRQLHRDGAGTLKIAAQYGVGYTHICHIVARRSWKHAP